MCWSVMSALSATYDVDLDVRAEPAPALLAQEELVVAAPERLDRALDAGHEGRSSRPRSWPSGQRNSASCSWRCASVGSVLMLLELLLEPLDGLAVRADAVDQSTAQRIVIVSSSWLGSYSASNPPGALLRPAPPAPGVRSLPLERAVGGPGLGLLDLRLGREVLAGERAALRLRPARDHAAEGGVADLALQREHALRDVERGPASATAGAGAAVSAACSAVLCSRLILGRP